MKRILQGGAIGLMAILSASNVALYTVARQAQSQQDRLQAQVERDAKTSGWEWRELQKTGTQDQEFADHLHAIDKRLDRLEAQDDDIRHAQNAIEGAQTEMRREMASVRKDYEQVRNIIYADEKARISEDTAKDIHNILSQHGGR